jgi:predicted nucleotidyltransferase
MGGKGPEEIRGFVKKVKEKFRPAVIILFGSRARGEGLKHSDYDLVVVSPKFEGMPFLERLSRLYGLWNLPAGADLLAYTPEEFERKKKELGVVREAAREGRRVG